ncbi:MAG: MerR family transcriptional regulator [Thermoleophilaceae bacterium]|nr:MerR family transcriptional regulator [Thermoleophilaceae bacterium]
MSDNNAPLAIGELARRAGTAPSALRYYERIGLLPPAERAGGKRHYPPSSAERLALVRLYQDAGFTLKEIRQLLAAGSRRRASSTPLAERKIAELDARIAEAQRAKNLLRHALGCPHRDLLTCPNFRAALQARLEAGSRGGQ